MWGPPGSSVVCIGVKQALVAGVREPRERLSITSVSLRSIPTQQAPPSVNWIQTDSTLLKDGTLDQSNPRPLLVGSNMPPPTAAHRHCLRHCLLVDPPPPPPAAHATNQTRLNRPVHPPRPPPITKGVGKRPRQLSRPPEPSEDTSRPCPPEKPIGVTRAGPARHRYALNHVRSVENTDRPSRRWSPDKTHTHSARQTQTNEPANKHTATEANQHKRTRSTHKHKVIHRRTNTELIDPQRNRAGYFKSTEFATSKQTHVPAICMHI